MDQRHAELARIGLAAVGRYGFALAGGYALSAHGLIDRASEDLELFTNRLEPDEFTGAVEAITEAYAQAGHAVDVVRRAELFARLLVGGADPVRVELAYDWRGNRPALLDIGPVLDRDDAVAGKMLYSEATLLELAARADNGFDHSDFGRMFTAVADRPDSSFADYGFDPAEICALRDLLETGVRPYLIAHVWCRLDDKTASSANESVAKTASLWLNT